jgi:endonuclease VIII
MPEGHTIHRAALDQRPLLVGSALKVSSPQGRFSDGAARLNSQRCMGIEAYGKHLLYHFESQDTLHIHLGLYGRFRMAQAPVPEPQGAVRVRMISPTHGVDINGPSTCEILGPEQVVALALRIGPDVLRADADPERAWLRISKSRTGIGQLIMDQTVMAGVGNIYRSEILWRQRLHPSVPGLALDRLTFDRIWKDSAYLLAIGVRENVIITNETSNAAMSKYGERVNIFEKSECPVCDGPILKTEIAGRRAFICEICQPLMA